MIAQQPPQGFTLVTGATGFLGHVILADLLTRGHRCVVLSRAQAASTQQTIAALLGDQNLCATELQARGRLEFMPGALPEALPRMRLPIARIVHCAASTRFTTDDRGEPARTNEHGTRSLLEFATLQGVREFHLISTAYSCGVVNGPVPEEVLQAPLHFRNSYERSKWAAEVQVQEWARSPGHTATILRPSIIVGDSRTGRASKFNGLYLAFRAYDRCVRSWRQEGRGTGVFELRVEGGPTDRMNFVPVDHIAALIAHVVSNPEHHGSVYNLVDPAPMTNQELLDAMQQHYGLSGASFVPVARTIDHPPSPEDRSFASAISGQRAYLVTPPTFVRASTQQLE
ncbi:MAG: SDR family oxidoreductase [Planctomycetota bacterium]|nr:SDR family oxidoreductase [Planctomycetota bacterium]